MLLVNQVDTAIGNLLDKQESLRMSGRDFLTRGMTLDLSGSGGYLVMRAEAGRRDGNAADRREGM